MSAIAIFIFEDGIVTSSLCAVVALRIRASMSAIGSVIVIASPARLRDSRHLARVRELAQADATQAELPVVGARASTALAPVVLASLELRRPLLFLDQTFLGHRSLRLEGEAESLEERPG